jgi:hypothetical protein
MMAASPPPLSQRVMLGDVASQTGHADHRIFVVSPATELFLDCKQIIRFGVRSLWALT